jgi:predicted O-methyltransferase YrrM
LHGFPDDKSTTMTAFRTPEDFREVVYSFQRSRIILTGYELGIFTALDDEKKASIDVAALIGADARATDRLMNALVVCGLLIKENNLFMNDAFAAKYLVKGKMDYLAGFGHSANMWHTWSGLSDAVRTGHTVRTSNRSEDWTETFIAAMHERASRQAPNVIAKLDINNVQRVLDVGGGSGAYSIAFAQAEKGLKAVVFDLPHVLPFTQQYINAAGLGETIKVQSGNYLSDDLGTGYDMVFLSAIVHINSYVENADLIRRCALALNPGGQVVIQDHVMQDDRVSPPQGAFFALNMLVGTERGDTYTEKEMTEWMQQSGLSDFQRIETFNNAMMIGRKR